MQTGLGTAGTGGIANFKCWMRSYVGWQLQGMGGHCPEEGRGKLSGVVPRQTPTSALQAIQPLWTVPCSLKQAGSAGQAQSSHEWMRGSEWGAD